MNTLFAMVRFRPTPPARKLSSRTKPLALEMSNSASTAARAFWLMAPSKRRKGMEARERAEAMRSRNDVNWEKTTDLLHGELDRMRLRCERSAAILADESVPMRRRVIRGGGVGVRGLEVVSCGGVAE